MEFYRIWRILVGHKRVLIWLPIVATCVGLGLAFVLPEQYVSTALVLVRPAEELKFNSSAETRRSSTFQSAGPRQSTRLARLTWK